MELTDTRVNLCGVILDNPVIPASGCFGYGYEFAELYDINCLGALTVKGTTREARYGNPTPRIAETPSGMLNAVGLQNPGIERVINDELPRLRQVYRKPVIANIGGFSTDEFAYCAAAADASDDVDIIELNISCPNLHAGGTNFGCTPEGAASAVAAARRAVKKPLIVKLTPNVTDICSIARAAEAEGADGISLINTLLGMRIDCRRRKPVLANGTGGLSGRAVFPVALRMVYQVYEAVNIPILGMGGVASAADVIEMMMAGATSVGIGAANLADPFVCRDIVNNLPDVMKKYSITKLSDIIGGAH